MRKKIIIALMAFSMVFSANSLSKADEKLEPKVVSVSPSSVEYKGALEITFKVEGIEEDFKTENIEIVVKPEVKKVIKDRVITLSNINTAEKFNLKLKLKGSDFTFENGSDTFEHEMVPENWNANINSQYMSVKVVSKRAKINFSSKGFDFTKDLKIGGNIVGKPYIVKVNEVYDLKLDSKIKGSIILDPREENPKEVTLADGKLIVTKPGSYDVKLVNRLDENPAWNYEKLSQGDKTMYLNVKSKKAYEELKIQRIAVVVGDKIKATEKPSIYDLGEKGVNVEIELPKEVNKGDELAIYTYYKDGSMSYDIKSVGGSELALDVEAYKGQKYIDVKTEKNSDVRVYFSGKAYSKRASDDGKARVMLDEELKKDSKLTVYAVDSYAKKQSKTLEIIVDKSQANGRVSTKIMGSNRYTTSVSISKELFAQDKKADTVILANGGDTQKVDALSAGPLSIEKKAPILLVEAKSVAKEVKAEIERLGAKNIIIVGGENSVSKEIQDSFGKGIKVERLAGENRYATAVKIAEYLNKHHNYKSAIIANGRTSVDAMVAGKYAADNDKAILLTEAKELSPETQKAIEELKFTDITVVGGENSVSAEIKTKLKAKDRISGENRYKTAIELAGKTHKEMPKGVILVSSDDKGMVDALASALLSNEKDMPILLTAKKPLSEETKKYIESFEKKDEGKGIAELITIGGSNSIDPSIANAFEAMPKVN